MKILLVHNSYMEQGGEDEIVRKEKQLLEQNGHEIIYYHRSNDEIAKYNWSKKWQFFIREAIWSARSYEEIKTLLDRHKPDVVHMHNTYYVISPSVYQACREAGVPVIQSLHNYRILLNSRNAASFPEFDPPKDLKKILLRFFLLPRILSKVTQEKIYQEKVAKIVLLSDFCKRVFLKNGFDDDKLDVIAPSVDVPKCDRRDVGTYAIFAGRLVEYKGIDLLLQAMAGIPDFHLRIAGDGPLKNKVEAIARSCSNIDYLGRLAHAQLMDEIKKSAFLIFPSLCYETFGQVILEAFACGVPVLASRDTTAEELVEEGKTGLFFTKGDARDLTQKIRQLSEDPALIAQMGKNARRHYEEKYSGNRHYEKLVQLYEKVLTSKK